MYTLIYVLQIKCVSLTSLDWELLFGLHTLQKPYLLLIYLLTQIKKYLKILKLKYLGHMSHATYLN